ncbi:MAG: MerR family transcriptional regulator [Anaerolineales bacterium]|jgi:predicted transcriptional regulator YdeE
MLKIGEFAKLSKVSKKTLRYYHQVGLLKPAWTNRYNRYRYYETGQLATLNNILTMKELGFSLEEIQTILQEDLSPTQMRSMLRLKKAELEHQIREDQARLQKIEARLARVDTPNESSDHRIKKRKPMEVTQMEPKIVSKPAFTVVGLEYFGKNENDEIKAMWDTECIDLEKEIQHTVQTPILEWFGVCGEMDDQGNFRYLAAVEVTTAKDLPEGMSSWDVPEQTYVVVPCTIPTIGNAYEFIHGTWLPQSGYKRAPGPDFELYDETFDSNNPDSTLYIYVPIIK